MTSDSFKGGVPARRLPHRPLASGHFSKGCTEKEGQETIAISRGGKGKDRDSLKLQSFFNSMQPCVICLVRGAARRETVTERFNIPGKMRKGASHPLLWGESFEFLCYADLQVFKGS